MWKKLAGEIAFEAISYGLNKAKKKKRNPVKRKTTSRKTPKRGK